MADGPEVHNQLSGGEFGAVLQAGSVHHVSLGTPARVDALVPRQLPLAVRGFTGRTEHLAVMDALLPAAQHDGGTVVISAVDGTAGVGKTTLAVQWAHRVQHLFPDGTLFANLRGYGPGEPASPSEVLQAFLHALGVPPERIPFGVDAQAGVYRSVLANKQTLIVLDNANTAGQVRPLLPASSGCLVLVTSRANLTGLVIGEAATRVTLDLLSPGEALELVQGILGVRRTDLEPVAVVELIQLCTRLPLALRIATGQLATHAHTSVAELVEEMRDERARLDALSGSTDDATALRTVFEWSYQRLTVEQARLFRRLGLHPGPEISLPVAAAVAGLDTTRTRRLLDALADVHLIQAVARNRYRFHDLLRLYAIERAERDDSDSERDHVCRTVLQWYGHHVKTSHGLRGPAYSTWHPALDLTSPADPVLAFTSFADAWAWFEIERDNLIASANHAVRHNLHKLAMLFARTVGWALQWRGRWAESLIVFRLGLIAARSDSNRICETYALIDLGEVYQAVSQLDDAFMMFQKALTLARDLGERALEACALNDLGFLHLRQGQYVEAIERLLMALPLSSGAQRGRLEGVIEVNLSRACAEMRRYEQALKHAERSLVFRRQAGDIEGEAFARLHMAQAWQCMDNHVEAIALCEKALDLENDNKYLPAAAATLDTLGTSLRHVGESARAISCWRDALAIYEELGDYRAAELKARLQELEAAEPVD
jgi:tetratricopeptide (TPR) repeat protein